MTTGATITHPMALITERTPQDIVERRPAAISTAPPRRYNARMEPDRPFRCTTRGCAGTFDEEARYCPVCGKRVRHAKRMSAPADNTPKEETVSFRSLRDDLLALLAIYAACILVVLFVHGC
ncbi:MAG: hypothetical protein GX547_05100 [Phycisphaerae bacterium]|nr:hypothetical protein [Phycisphaerae bacterium]